MATTQTDLYQIPLQSIDGRMLSKEELKSKVVLFVNTASECGYTPQLKGLEALYEKYKAKNFVVIGVPCNQFGGQEPGAEKEIKEFCETHYGVRFPLLKKADVKGASRHPLYKFLIENSSNNDDIAWNFEKFLVGQDGQVIARFKSSVKPEDAGLTALIEKALDKASFL